MHVHSNTDFQDPTTFQFQVHSLNRILILLILQLETDYFSSLFISESPTRSRGIKQPSKTSRNFITEKIFYTQKVRRSSCTSNHPTRPSKGIPVIHDIQPFQAILHASRDSTLLQHSSTRMHILHLDWFPQKLHRVPVEALQTANLQTSKKGRCCDVVRNDIFSRIEFMHPSVLSSDNTHHKNDIQLLMHPFDEL